MDILDQKKLLVERILPYLSAAPDDVVQRLLQKSVSDLETILEDAITTKARAEADDRVAQHADEMRRESQLEGAFAHACMAVINNRRLSTCDRKNNATNSTLTFARIFSRTAKLIFNYSSEARTSKSSQVRAKSKERSTRTKPPKPTRSS